MSTSLFVVTNPTPLHPPGSNNNWLSESQLCPRAAGNSGIFTAEGDSDDSQFEPRSAVSAVQVFKRKNTEPHHVNTFMIHVCVSNKYFFS